MQDPPENDPEWKQPGYWQPAHPPGDCVGIKSENVVEAVPVELCELEVQLPSPGQGPRANGINFAQAPADVAPAAHIAPPPAAAPQHLGG